MSKYVLEESPLWLDIKSILTDGQKPIKYEYRGMLHTEKEDIAVYKVMALDVIRDYANKVGDVIRIELKMPLGDYAIRFYPFRNNLEFSIKKLLLKENSDDFEENAEVFVEKFKAVFLPEENPSISASDIERIDKETLDNADMVDVKLQLLDRSLEPLRIKTTQGVYKKYTPEELIHVLLGGESLKVSIDGKPSIDGLNLVEPDNKEKRDHTVVPTGTLITSIPTFIQEKKGGVYNAGIGTYLQTYKEEKLWFVFPQYNYKRFDTTKDDRLIIYAVPQERLDGVDRTYKVDGKILYVLTTENKRYRDNADLKYMNQGSGYRMPDARALMKKPVVLSEEGVKGNRVRYNHEATIEERDDGLNFAPVIPSGPGSNPFREISRIAVRQMATIEFIWENSNPDLIYPGMPCKYVFLDDGEIRELRGTVLFCQSLTVLMGQGVSGRTYRTKSALTIVTEEKYNVREFKEYKSVGTF